MAFTYTLTTSIGQMRLLLPDRVTPGHIFEDDELQAFLTLEGDIRTATALALETIASDQVLVLKVMSLLDVSTSGDRVSAALIARAKLLREQAELNVAAATGSFDWAEMVTTDFAARERLYNQALRDAIP
jgi:hypothetical protein